LITDEQVLSGAFTARSKKANGIAGVDLDHGTVASAPKHHNGSVVGTDLAREDVPSWPVRGPSDDLERRLGALAKNIDDPAVTLPKIADGYI